jgi:hypothetical protein
MPISSPMEVAKKFIKAGENEKLKRLEKMDIKNYLTS